VITHAKYFIKEGVFLNYCISIFLVVLDITAVIFFYIRKKMIGEILEKASPSKNCTVYLIFGLFSIFALGIRELIFYITLKGYLSNTETILIVNEVLIGTFFIIMFFTSKIYFGTEGVLVPTIPFYIPKYQIINYSLLSNTIILEINAKKPYKLKIKTKDVNKIKSVLSLLND